MIPTADIIYLALFENVNVLCHILLQCVVCVFVIVELVGGLVGAVGAFLSPSLFSSVRPFFG